jgi:hypothetical protein
VGRAGQRTSVRAWAPRTRSPNRFDALLAAGRAAGELGERDVAANYYRTLLANCTSANGKALEALRHAPTALDEMTGRLAPGNASASAPDLLFAYYQGAIGVGVDPAWLGATWFIPTFAVPFTERRVLPWFVGSVFGTARPITKQA